MTRKETEAMESIQHNGKIADSKDAMPKAKGAQGPGFTKKAPGAGEGVLLEASKM